MDNIDMIDKIKELTERIEALEERQTDISYFLANPNKLNFY
tara:strand:- start:767 stop:889 length:123 start_codon:yes stop_codon:yes gene_type:complete